MGAPLVSVVVFVTVNVTVAVVPVATLPKSTAGGEMRRAEVAAWALWLVSGASSLQPRNREQAPNSITSVQRALTQGVGLGMVAHLVGETRLIQLRKTAGWGDYTDVSTAATSAARLPIPARPKIAVMWSSTVRSTHSSSFAIVAVRGPRTSRRRIRSDFPSAALTTTHHDNVIGRKRGANVRR